MNLYQICVPCLVKWNSITTQGFNIFQPKDLYTGEYLKVAIKEEYEKGTAAEFKTKTLYQNFKNQTYTYDISYYLQS